MRVRPGFPRALILALALLAGCGSGDDAGGGATSAVTTSTPVAGTPLPVVRQGLAPRAAADAGRADCPDDWAAYDDGRLSICYPARHYAEKVIVPAPDGSEFFSVRLTLGAPMDQDPHVLIVRAIDTYTEPKTCVYAGAAVDQTEETSFDDYEAGGLKGAACTASIPGSTQFKGELQTDGGGIRFVADAADDAQLALAKEMLATLRSKD